MPYNKKKGRRNNKRMKKIKRGSADIKFEVQSELSYYADFPRKYQGEMAYRIARSYGASKTYASRLKSQFLKQFRRKNR